MNSRIELLNYLLKGPIWDGNLPSKHDRDELCKAGLEEIGEVIAQHTLSIRDLESCIMRQGMALKYIGTPNPYPESKNPSSTVVEPTADGLKM